MEHLYLFSHSWKENFCLKIFHIFYFLFHIYSTNDIVSDRRRRRGGWLFIAKDIYQKVRRTFIPRY